MLGMTAVGVVKSITQSKLLSVSLSSAAAPGILLATHGSHFVTARRCDLRNQRIRSCRAQGVVHGSSVEGLRIHFRKKSLCSRRTTSGTSLSSITKLMLISTGALRDHAHVHVRDGAEDLSPRCRDVSRIFSPTRQTMAFRPSYFTSASLARSAAIAGMASFESTVSETLTSEVETMSTGQRCWSKTSKMALEKPVRQQHARGDDVHDGDALLRGDRLERVLAWARMRGDARAFVLRIARFRTRTGIFFCTAGSMVAGCSTLAPK